MNPLDAACEALRMGQGVLLYDMDGREEETDMVFASQHVTPEAIRQMREDAGGLVCTTVAPEHHRLLGLPWLSDVLQQAATDHPLLAALAPRGDIRYDASKPSFGITINHRDTFTGITDEDRSLTICALADFLGTAPASSKEAQTRFGASFRAPGHCILLNGADGGLGARQGHTELSIELARQAGVVPSTTICEMMDHGRALSKKGAMAYAKAHDLVFLTGQDIVAAWQDRSSPTAKAPVPTSA